MEHPVYQEMLDEVLHHPIYSKYYYDASLIFGEFWKKWPIPNFDGLYKPV